MARFHDGFVWKGLLRASLALSLIYLPPAAATAQNLGGLSISPKRLVFEGRHRSAEVLLINRGTTPATFRIFFRNQRMTEDGVYQEIETPAPDELFADRMIRYAPRQIEVAAGEAQSVRVLLRKPRDLAPGEYRSHLVFKTLPPESVGASIEDLDPGEISIAIIPTYAISIPVIVREGELEATAAIGDLAFQPSDPQEEGAPTLAFRIRRDGEKSLYGDIDVLLRGGGEPVTVGIVRGLSVLTPNEARRVKLRLAPPEGVDLRSGTLEVVYRAPQEEGGGELARAVLAR